MRQRMCLMANTQVGGLEGVLNLADELVMWDRTPAICGAWCVDVADFIKVCIMSSAVKSEVGCSAGGYYGYGFEVCNHGGIWVLG